MTNFQTEHEVYYDIETKLSDIQAYMKTRVSSFNERQVMSLVTNLRDRCDEIEKDYRELEEMKSNEQLKSSSYEYEDEVSSSANEELVKNMLGQ